MITFLIYNSYHNYSWRKKETKELWSAFYPKEPLITNENLMCFFFSCISHVNFIKMSCVFFESFYLTLNSVYWSEATRKTFLNNFSTIAYTYNTSIYIFKIIRQVNISAVSLVVCIPSILLDDAFVDNICKTSKNFKIEIRILFYFIDVRRYMKNI